MRLLTFQAKRFGWRPFTQTLDDAPDPGPPGEVTDAVVAFVHAEPGDEDQRSRVFKHTLKHLKWLANKRQMKVVVLHSFTHLGEGNAPAEFALGFLRDLRDRLESTGYSTWITPFGWFCEWDLSVYGESLAKVFKRI